MTTDEKRNVYVEQEIADNVYITVEKEEEQYIYCLKENNEEAFLARLNERPRELKPKSIPKNTLKSKIEKYVLPSQYSDLGIDVYINQFIEKFEKNLKIKEANTLEEKEKKEYLEYFVRGYTYQDNMYWKTEYINGELILNYEVLKGKITHFLRIADYSNDTNNMFEIGIEKMNKDNTKKEKFNLRGTKSQIVDTIMKSDLA